MKVTISDLINLERLDAMRFIEGKSRRNRIVILNFRSSEYYN